jgi:DNA-binding transcriptional MerR regulator
MNSAAEQLRDLHPLRVVTDRTGLSADVLRAWERRHSVVVPRRSAGGQRRYSDADIERLSLLSKAIRGGRSVGQLAALPDEALRRLVAEDAAATPGRSGGVGPHLAAATEAVRELDPERLAAALRRALLALGAPGFLDEVVVPLLDEVGQEWHRGTVTIAQEHAASMVVQQLLTRLIGELEDPAGGPVLLLATLSHEHHALGALMAGAMAALDGWRVIWLGVDVPAEQVAAAAIQHRARAVGVSVVNAGSAAAGGLAALRSALPERTALIVGGAGGAVAARGIPGAAAVGDLAGWRTRLRVEAPPRPRRGQGA